jgi:hypothetical protein
VKFFVACGWIISFGAPATNKRKERMMKRIVMLIVLLTMFVSLGGCFWGFEGRGRGGDRDDRGGRSDHGGVHEGERGERPERR